MPDLVRLAVAFAARRQSEAYANGLVWLSGHRGHYRVEVTAKGHTATQDFDLPGTGDDVVVKLR